MSAGVDRRLLEALQQASTLQLYQLSALIDRMLADPKRILSIRKELHWGQTVRFVNWDDGQMCTGTVVELRNRRLTILEEGTHCSWDMPYVAVEPPSSTASSPLPEPEPATAPRTTRNDFRCGEQVTFENKYLNAVVGTIVQINQCTATIDSGDGTTWRVGFDLLRRVGSQRAVQRAADT